MKQRVVVFHDRLDEQHVGRVRTRLEGDLVSRPDAGAVAPSERHFGEAQLPLENEDIDPVRTRPKRIDLVPALIAGQS
jgi:hypothetical protein